MLKPCGRGQSTPGTVLWAHAVASRPEHKPRSPLRFARQVLANSLDACPPPLRQLLHCIADTVGAAFAGANGGDLDVANRAVGGLFFLRFVAPALLHPHLHGVTHDPPSESVPKSTPIWPGQPAFPARLAENGRSLGLF